MDRRTDMIDRLYELWHRPGCRGVYEGTDFAEAARDFTENRKWLRRRLKDEEYNRFRALMNQHQRICAIERREGFRAGLRMGAALARDIENGVSRVFYSKEP